MDLCVTLDGLVLFFGGLYSNLEATRTRGPALAVGA